MPRDNKLSHHVLQKLNFAENTGFQRQMKKSFLAGSQCPFTEKESSDFLVPFHGYDSKLTMQINPSSSFALFQL